MSAPNTGHRLNGFGTTPEIGEPAQGPTKLPTWWVWYPELGNIPRALLPGELQQMRRAAKEELADAL